MASAGWQLVSVDHAAVIDIPHDALCLQLGRNQLAEAASKANAPQVEFAFVSRVQLALTAGTEGALKLESLGTNAILVSSGGTGPWEKLCRGETRTLLAGDKIAFDNKWRTGTVVQLRRRGTPPPSCRWLWDSGRGADERWTAYSSVDSAEIERQFIAGADRCALGAERHVDFSSMRQVRNDNPSRYRGVRREVIAGAAGASASSDAEPAHAAARREAMTDPPAEDAAEELAPEPKRQRLVEGGEERERRGEPIQAAGLPSALSPLSGSQDAAGSASSPSASVVGSTPAPMQAFTLTPGGGHSPAPASTTLSSAGRAAPTVPLPVPLVSPQAAPAPPETATEDIFFFWGAKSADGPRACLSNFYVAPFVEPSAPNTACSPRRFFCMEQFMVLKKAELFGDADASSAVMALTSDPAACKKIGRAVRGVSEQRWAAVARDIVEDGAYLKFSQNPPLARFLVSTAARMLVEASPYDRIWGIGFSEREAMRRPRTEWGSNWLGQALMKVRARLADGTAEGLYGISDAPVDASPAAAITLPALSAGTSQAVDLSSDDEKDDAPASGVALAPFDSVVGALAPVTSRAAAASAPLAASAASAVVSAAASAAASLAAAPAASFPPATHTLLAGDKIAFDHNFRTGTVVQLRRCGGSPSPDNISSAASSFAVCCEDQVPEGGAKRPRNQMSLSDRVGAGRRISWDGTRLETLEDWLSSVPPSKVSPEVAAWIQVNYITHNSPGFCDYNAIAVEPYVRELDKIKAHIARTVRVPAAAKKACVQAILGLAQEQRRTAGKWMIFFPPDEADAGWGIIARATAKGQLGCSAKIAPAQDSMQGGKVVLCCIYVYDFADRAEVRRVLLALQELGMNVRSGFKPDIFTELNINGENEWRLEPTIFRVEEASAWPADIARETYQKVRASPWGS